MILALIIVALIIATVETILMLEFECDTVKFKKISKLWLVVMAIIAMFA